MRVRVGLHGIERYQTALRQPQRDAWSVGQDEDGRLWVQHSANQPSGGKTSLVGVETFLAERDNYGPQHNALLKLLRSEGDIDRQSGPSSDAHPLDDRAAKALGYAVMDIWVDLPRDVQEALFEVAIIADERIERDGTFRAQLAQFLHDRHPRTAG